jgi:phenylpropionate dioxygenase-like ring-hydroxylating dioxygenase large terminal subunit
MNVNSETVNPNRKPKTFNNSERFIEGWYWVIPSHNLQVGEVKSVTILGRKLVVYRGKDRRAVILDAFCPHMGAHLAEGKVEGNDLRCFFHHWKFDGQGICVDIPCLDKPIPLKLKSWPTAEKYNLIWIWTGENPQQPLPFIPEWEHRDYDVVLGVKYFANCHPNVVAINPIDAQHFNTVHKLRANIVFEKQELNHNAIIFNNLHRADESKFWLRFFMRLCKNDFIYSICYWYGTNTIVTIGPDFLHIHIMLAMRLIEGGKTECQSLLMMKKRRGVLGKLWNRFVMFLMKMIGHYFIQGDRRVLETIEFNLKTPLKADQAIMQFIHHLEKQKPLMWKTWNLARDRTREPEKRENLANWRDELVND